MPKVRDAIRLITAHGWVEVRRRGSHRQYGHPARPGLVTIPGTALTIWLSEPGTLRITDMLDEEILVVEDRPAG